MSQERAIRLHAGPWSLDFERWSGWVRRIRVNGQEVVRAIYANVRDENWATQSQRVVHINVSQEADSFEAGWRVELDDLSYTWTGRLVCDGKTLEIEWSGESGQEYQTRRTGMCVLHPQELRGFPCTVEHSDGRTEEGTFPNLVEPHQPFLDIRAVSYGGFRAEFSGEVFEMEDQRNWTDASFKTYCRPQEWPQPYTVASGETLTHGLKMTFEGASDGWTPDTAVDFGPYKKTVTVPRLGTVSSGPVDGFDFHLHENDWSAIGLGKIDFREGGFVDLNRNRPQGDWDGVAFTATPQVHTFDERSIMENVFGLLAPVETAKELTHGGKVCVGPIVFRRAKQGRDPRLDWEIAPAWFLASILVLAEAGADAACFLEASEFRGPMREALETIAGKEQIELYEPSAPYCVMAFSDGASDILINLRPYSTFVRFGGDVELGPYEIRRVNRP